MTPNEVITEARRLVQDTKAPFRYSDQVMLGFVNQTLRRMVILRPDLFSTIEDIATTENSFVQSLPSSAVRLVEIFRVKNGGALTEVSRDMLDMSTPDWVSTPAGSPVNYVRHVRNPTRYFLYPPPSRNTQLVAEYVKTPPVYTIDASISVLPDAYFPILIDGVVFLVESIDNEHVNSNRAKLFQDAFVQGLGVALQSRTITDTEPGGMNPKEVS
jgi:hypothetical protein